MPRSSKSERSEDMNDLYRLYHLADENGVTVDGFDLGRRDALSFTDEDGRCYIAIDPFKLESVADEKSKLAHELGHLTAMFLTGVRLGHCVTGSFYHQYAACDVRQQHENRADKWAIARLVPKDELDRAVEAGHTEIWDLAELFNVTEPFMRKAAWWYTYGNLAVEI